MIHNMHINVALYDNWELHGVIKNFMTQKNLHKVNYKEEKNHGIC